MLCTHGENQQRQEHVGRVVVDRPQQPAAGDLVLQEVDALPGGLCAGAVVHPEKEAGDRLDAEGEQDGARQDLAAARPARNGRFASQPHPSPNQSIVEPSNRAFIIKPRRSRGIHCRGRGGHRENMIDERQKMNQKWLAGSRAAGRSFLFSVSSASSAVFFSVFTPGRLLPPCRRRMSETLPTLRSCCESPPPACPCRGGWVRFDRCACRPGRNWRHGTGKRTCRPWRSPRS